MQPLANQRGYLFLCGTRFSNFCTHERDKFIDKMAWIRGNNHWIYKLSNIDDIFFCEYFLSFFKLQRIFLRLRITVARVESRENDEIVLRSIIYTQLVYGKCWNRILQGKF